MSDRRPEPPAVRVNAPLAAAAETLKLPQKQHQFPAAGQPSRDPRADLMMQQAATSLKLPGTPVPAAPPGTPATPAAAAATAQGAAPKKTPKSKALEPVTVEDKAEDLRKRILAKAGTAGKLRLQMSSHPYGGHLCDELQKCETSFTDLYTDVTRLINQKVSDEAKYLPFGKQFLLLCKDLERPQASAESLARSARPSNPETKRAAKKHKAAPASKA